MSRETKTEVLAITTILSMWIVIVAFCLNLSACNTGADQVYPPVLSKAKALAVVHAEELQAFEGKIDKTITPEELAEFQGYVRDAQALAQTLTDLYKPFETKTEPENK